MSSEGGGGSGVGSDFVFFIGILAVIFAVWVGSGGPDRPISFAGPFLRPIGTTATSAQAYGDPNAYQPIQGTSWIPFSDSSVSTGDASEYRGVVTLSRDTSGAKNTKANSEYVTIQLSLGATSPLSTAGWKLVSETRGVTVSLPQGAELARSGNVNQLSSITLRPGDQAIVVSGRSPVGVSFRENMCTGYLEEHQDFSPPLYLSCPSITADYEEYGDGESNDSCVSYLRGIGQCQTKASYSGTAPSSCKDFIDDYVNYNGCIGAHKNDSGFYNSTWRVYLNSRDELWKNERETILLQDASGKTIDAISY